jgi:hypothetical protein
MSLFAKFKWFVSRFTIIPNYCHKCGRQAEAFTMTSDLWNKATGAADPLCFRCFDSQARARGVYPVWVVTQQKPV